LAEEKEKFIKGFQAFSAQMQTLLSGTHEL